MMPAFLSRTDKTVPPANVHIPSKTAPGSLRIGESNDYFEQEADRIADEVLAGSKAGLAWSLSRIGIGTNLQRKCVCGRSEGPEGECEECKKKEMLLQRRATSELAHVAVPPLVYEVLRSPGQPLDAEVRSFFERRFGHDFADIRIHTDDRAADSALATKALAYTVGSNIVFARGTYAPETGAGKRLLAHELAHSVQQAQFHRPRAAGRLGFSVASRGLLQRQTATPPAKGPTAQFDGCDPKMQEDLRAKQGPALEHVNGAIRALANGWQRMSPADKAVFQKFFDPGGSGEIDEGFVKDVRRNFERIRRYMSALRFDCDPTSRTICGTSDKWCIGGRLMWTCFGALHVCTNAYPSADDSFKIETMIHESVHNALHTTDREYADSKDFSRLTPRGSGILSFLSNIPIIGVVFRLFRSNRDTLNNPDSYARFATEL
jgi:hypothetical protein